MLTATNTGCENFPVLLNEPSIYLQHWSLPIKFLVTLAFKRFSFSYFRRCSIELFRGEGQEL